jgi:cytochrome bd-type quinol oxidase subunit 2
MVSPGLVAFLLGSASGALAAFFQHEYEHTRPYFLFSLTVSYVDDPDADASLVRLLAFFLFVAPLVVGAVAWIVGKLWPDEVSPEEESDRPIDVGRLAAAFVVGSFVVVPLGCLVDHLDLVQWPLVVVPLPFAAALTGGVVVSLVLWLMKSTGESRGPGRWLALVPLGAALWTFAVLTLSLRDHFGAIYAR